jgi:hypothetical protein
LVAGRSFCAICRHPHRCYQNDGAANLANALFRTLFLPVPSNLYHGLMADLVPWVMYGCLLLACLVQCLVACMIGWVAFGPALISDVWFLHLAQVVVTIPAVLVLEVVVCQVEMT